MMRTAVMRGNAPDPAADPVAAFSCRKSLRPGVERNDDADASAAAGATLETAAPAQRLHALLHAADAEAGRCCGIDSAAVVLHRQREMHGACIAGRPILARFGECDADLSRPRMAHR